MSEQNNTSDSDFSESLVCKIASEAIAEQRRSRRWGIFFKFLFAFYILFFLILYIPPGFDGSAITGEKHTALIDIEGVISTDTEANADYIVSGLRAAFEDKNTAGIVLRINSPGGSPVQAGYVNDEIKRLRELYPDIPLYAVITDICASGGYYIASAAEKIYADKASVIGSIGVIMAGFGFVEAMDKLGIERRLFYAGESKGLLDPFSPLNPKEVTHIEGVLDNIYQQFIEIVKRGRGDRLKDDDRIFTGLVWTGQQSLELGLIDELGSPGYVAREVFGAEEIVDYTKHESYFDLLGYKISSKIANLLSSKFELR